MSESIITKQHLKKMPIIQNLENNKFENDEINSFYNNCINMTQLEYRIYECKTEEYEYFDLSNLEMTDEKLNDTINLNTDIFLKINLIDLSNNNITDISFLNNFSNIKYVIASHNKIMDINLNFVEELDCSENNIENVNSNSIYDLNVSNNILLNYNCPNLKYLNVVNNPIKNIQYQSSLNILSCSTNQISINFKIKHIEKLNKIYYVEFFGN